MQAFSYEPSIIGLWNLTFYRALVSCIWPISFSFHRGVIWHVPVFAKLCYYNLGHKRDRLIFVLHFRVGFSSWSV